MNFIEVDTDVVLRLILNQPPGPAWAIRTMLCVVLTDSIESSRQRHRSWEVVREYILTTNPSLRSLKGPRDSDGWERYLARKIQEMGDRIRIKIPEDEEQETLKARIKGFSVQ